MSSSTLVGSTGCARTIQIHPSRLCNLQCLHCYSSSSPHAHGALGHERLAKMLSAARGEEFNYVTISGGEPLLYPPLLELLHAAKSDGYTVGLVTNGTLLNAKRLASLQSIVDIIAISLDGTPSSHNTMRRSHNAFERMERSLAALRDSAIAFGFIFTLTQYNLDELDWVIDFAERQGARLLQLHPLESAGQAIAELGDCAPDEVEAGYACLLTQRVQERLGSKLHIQVDLAHKAQVLRYPQAVFADAVQRAAHTRPHLADALSALVVEPDGTIVPLSYGFSREFSLGHIDEPFDAICARWLNGGEHRFRALCSRVFDTIRMPSHPRVFNWDELVRAASHRFEQPISQAALRSAVAV